MSHETPHIDPQHGCLCDCDECSVADEGQYSDDVVCICPDCDQEKCGLHRDSPRT